LPEGGAFAANRQFKSIVETVDYIEQWVPEFQAPLGDNWQTHGRISLAPIQTRGRINGDDDDNYDDVETSEEKMAGRDNDLGEDNTS